MTPDIFPLYATTGWGNDEAEKCHDALHDCGSSFAESVGTIHGSRGSIDRGSHRLRDAGRSNCPGVTKVLAFDRLSHWLGRATTDHDIFVPVSAAAKDDGDRVVQQL